MNPKESIAIIGAGPAGLSTAYYLKASGYDNVTVLEKLGRVGGLCRTITQDYESFDLGANYITPAFREVLRVARRHGQKMYGERNGATVDLPPDGSPPVWNDIWVAAKNGMSTWTFLGKCWRYAWERFKVRRALKSPGFVGVSDHPELCVSFHHWLESHGIAELRVLFEMPITVMGYGFIRCPDESDPIREDKEIPAPYALKYMSLLTFITLVGKLSPLFRWVPWPKRFVLGYQRFWEVVAFRLNVQKNVRVVRIERSEGGVSVTFHRLQQVGNEMRPSEERTLHFDRLIIACPLQADVIGQMLDMTPEETDLFGHIVTYTYQMTSCHVRDFDLREQIVATIPLTPVGTPWAVTRQYENSDLIQFYARMPHNSVNYPSLLREKRQDDMNRARDAAPDEKERAKYDVEIFEPGHFCQGHLRESVTDSVRGFVDRIGGRIDDNAWQTYDEWPYFQHYRVEEIRAGFYDRLDALQGQNRTYYVGGLLNFELVNNIMLYAKTLVRAHF